MADAAPASADKPALVAPVAPIAVSAADVDAAPADVPATPRTDDETPVALAAARAKMTLSEWVRETCNAGVR